MIELEHVSAHRGERLALRDVSLRIEPGTVTALIGPNGAGKSTLFGLLSGRLRPTAGAISLGGEVAEVLQATAVDPNVRLTVHDIVRMGRYPTCRHLRRFHPADRDAIAAAIDHVDLTELQCRTLDELSGGQRQRALIAQGIAQDAPILLLDEPAAGLDGISQRRILDMMRALAVEGRTVVFSTHHLPDVNHADLVIALACQCICCAAPGAALHDSSVRALFDPFHQAQATSPTSPETVFSY